MKVFSTFAMLLMLLSSCNRYYAYNAILTHPIESKKLQYGNDTLNIKFSLYEQSIYFEIENKTNLGIKINWDETSFAIKGKTFRAIHKETGLD